MSSSRVETETPVNAGERAARLHRIVVGTDGSPRSRDAVDFAIDLASVHGAELMIVHVVPLLDRDVSLAIGEVDDVDDVDDIVADAFVREPTHHDREPLDEAAAAAAERGVDATTALLAGSVAEEIVTFAEAHDADLIVLSSRPHGAIAGALLGSVSLGVLKTASRPVLIVRGTQNVDAPKQRSGS